MSCLKSPSHLTGLPMFRSSMLALAVVQALGVTSAQAQVAATPGSSVFAQTVGPAHYASNANVARMVVELDRNGVPADGQTPVKFTLRLLNTEGAVVQGVNFVTLETTGGRLQLPGGRTDELGPGRMDVDRVTPGTQLKVENGVGEFSLLAPAEPMDVRVRITAGREEVSGVVSFLPELREMVAAGVVEGVINLGNMASSQLAQSRSSDVFEQEIRRFEQQFNDGKSSYAYRAAFFLKGRIKGDYLLTAAYDSDKDTRERMLRDIQPEQMYPVYGDASMRGFDAKSTSTLYVRIDKNKHYALFGDFNTGAGFSQLAGGGGTANLSKRQLGNFSRTLNGLRVHGETDRYVANVYASQDNLKQVIEEFPGRGVSGPYAVSNSSGVQNSEKVELVVRNRNQPAQILSTTPMVRFSDYTFEPFSGRILFSQPVPSVDANLNPVSVRITYEVEQGGEAFWLTGGDGQLRLNSHVEVGGSWVNDSNPLAPFQLGSANVEVKLGDKTTLVAEVARTTSTVNTGTGANTYVTPALSTRVGEVAGNAARVELQHTGKDWDVRAFAAQSDAEFNNQAASYTGGRSDKGVRAQADVNEALRVYAEALRAEDRVSGASREGGQVGLSVKATSRLTVDLGLRTVHEELSGNGNGLSVLTPLTAPLGATSSGSLASGGSGGFFGYGNSNINPQTGLPVVSNGTAYGTTSASSSLPQTLDNTSARLGLLFRATDRLDLRGEVEVGVDGYERHREAVGVDYRLAERTKAYARAESQTGVSSLYSISPSAHSNVLVAGIETGYMVGGQVFSEYRVRDAVNAQDMELASGVRNVWDIAEGLRLSSSAERLEVLSGSGQRATALTGGADWSANPLWRVSGRLEWRATDSTPTVAGTDTYLTTVAVARKLDRDWTLLARNYLLATDYRDRGDLLQNRFQIGAAYRDTDTNRINALGRYEYKVESDESVAPRNYRTAHIVSTHADYHPARPWWWTGRAAAKWVKEDMGGVSDSYEAYLLGGRVTYDVTEQWSVGLMANALYSPQGNATQWAQGAEVGYQVVTNLWLSAGVNWSGFYDRDLSGSDYTRQGIYLRLRWKFDEDLFRSSKPSVNRTLDRTP